MTEKRADNTHRRIVQIQEYRQLEIEYRLRARRDVGQRLRGLEKLGHALIGGRRLATSGRVPAR